MMVSDLLTGDDEDVVWNESRGSITLFESLVRPFKRLGLDSMLESLG